MEFGTVMVMTFIMGFIAGSAIGWRVGMGGRISEVKAKNEQMADIIAELQRFIDDKGEST